MRRFEFSDGKSNKFWEIEVEGSNYTTCHGRIGSAGRETTKRFYSDAHATQEADKAIAKKVKKGYVEVAEGSGDDATPEDDSPMAVLERKLAAEPKSYDDWRVYADALSEAGDPRSELITIGIALAQDEGDAKPLRRREKELLQSNAKDWFGKFVTDDDWRECFGWTLQTGYWGKIRLWVDYDHKDVDIPKALDHALGLGSAKFLRELVLGLTDAEGSGDYSPCTRVIAKHAPLTSLRHLHLGDFVRDESEISWVTVGNIGRLWSALPKLESMDLRGAGIGLGSPKSTTLTRLSIETGGLPRAAAESLGRAELPALESLSVWFGTNYYGGTCSAAQIKPIVENASFKGLRHLGLANSDFADELVGALAHSRWPKKLRSLDLSMGTMTDTGAERLLAKSEQLEKLERLDLSENGLSAEMCERIRKALPKVELSLDSQKQGDDATYVSVGE